METIILMQYIAKQLGMALLAIAENEGVELDATMAEAYFHLTLKERIPQILEEAKQDGIKGDLFGGLDTMRIDPLTRKSFEIGLKHGIVQYAKEIFEHSITKN
jgi:hypothetical protein